jgi:hypothetical protein
VQERVAAEAVKIEKKAQEKARGSLSVEIQDLKNQLGETATQRDAAQKAELEARARARQLDERAKTLDLEAARKLDAQRQKIQEEAAKRAEEQYQLKLAEKEKQILDAKKANEELKLHSSCKEKCWSFNWRRCCAARFPQIKSKPCQKGSTALILCKKF